MEAQSTTAQDSTSSTGTVPSGHAPTSQLSTTAWLAIFCWPLVVATATIVYTNKKSDERMVELIASRPDVAVVDDVQLIKLAIDNGAERYNPASVVEHIGQIVKRNGMEDTILLSKSMIMYAPESRRISVRSSSAPAQPVGELTK